MSYVLPYLNPIRFHRHNYGDFAFNQIPSFEYQVGYNQKYTHGDTPWIQVLSTIRYVDMYMKLVNIEGTIVKDYGKLFDLGTKVGDYYVYVFPYYFPSVSVAPVGVYFFQLDIVHTTGSGTFYSEPIKLVSDTENMITIEYGHDENDFDTVFTTPAGTTFMLRVEGGMRSEGFQPSGKYTLFQDLDSKTTVLQSKMFNVEKWTFGPSSGIPNHLADKINRIFGLTTVSINGVRYNRNESAKMERAGENGYPLSVWTMDLIKADNPFSDTFSLTPKLPFTADIDTITVDTTYKTADQTLY